MSEFKYSNNVLGVAQLVYSGRPKKFDLRISISITKEMHRKLWKYPNQSEVVRQALNDFFNKMEEKRQKNESERIV